MPRAYEEKGAYESQNEEKWPTKIKMEAIGIQKILDPQKIQIVPRAYESLDTGLTTNSIPHSLTKSIVKAA